MTRNVRHHSLSKPVIVESSEQFVVWARIVGLINFMYRVVALRIRERASNYAWTQIKASKLLRVCDVEGINDSFTDAIASSLEMS